jgi:hydrogenase maturation protease
MTASSLVIGFGNTLRSDDGAGPAVVRELETLRLPGVVTRSFHQLTPDLAESIARADHVIFVDARIGPPAEGLRIEPVAPPTQASQCLAHAINPATLVGLAGILYGRPSGRAWLVTIPIVDLAFGETLSASVREIVPVAVEAIIRLLSDPPEGAE